MQDDLSVSSRSVHRDVQYRASHWTFPPKGCLNVLSRDNAYPIYLYFLGSLDLDIFSLDQ